MHFRQVVHSGVWAYRLLRRDNYPLELDFIRRSLTSEDICFDVGAHSGTWSYPLSKIVHQVYAFEALPYYARVLRTTMTLLGAGNVTVVNKAVSDREGAVHLIHRDSRGRRLTGLTHVAGPNEETADTITVGTIPLDSFLGDQSLDGRRVGFIKCDVEGHECHVLAGAEQLLAKWRPWVFAEAKDDWFRRYGVTSRRLFEILESNGYRGFVFVADGTPMGVTATSYSGSGDVLFCPTR
jgi:FkbM family methyltransferase